MYSYPNQIPLAAPAIRQIVEAVSPFTFDRLYGGWSGSIIPTAAKQAVERSADRYIRAISK